MKLVKFILKWHFRMLIVNKLNIRLHVCLCVSKDVKINAHSEQTSNVMLHG
jgi:hypothetical protein